MSTTPLPADPLELLTQRPWPADPSRCGDAFDSVPVAGNAYESYLVRKAALDREFWNEILELSPEDKAELSQELYRHQESRAYIMAVAYIREIGGYANLMRIEE